MTGDLFGPVAQRPQRRDDALVWEAAQTLRFLGWRVYRAGASHKVRRPNGALWRLLSSSALVRLAEAERGAVVQRLAAKCSAPHAEAVIGSGRQ